MRLVVGGLMMGGWLFAIGCGSSSSIDDEGTGGEANGSGGSDLGGSGSGGLAGAGGAPQGQGGGLPGIGGRAGGTGGLGQAGAGGSGGGAVPDNPPDPELLARCLAVCERYERLACSNHDDANCRADCDEMARYATCEQQVTALLECVETAQVACDESGEARVQGCLTPVVDVFYCRSGLTLDPAWVAECEAYCDGLRNPSCRSSYDEDRCVAGCVGVPAFVPECAASYASLTSCSLEVGFVCDDELGIAVPDGCEAESLSFTECMGDRER